MASALKFKAAKDAEIIKRALADYGDENSHNFAEIAIGINPNARITGVMREDKKLLGAVHMALGNSSDTGGLVHSKTHMDGCVRYPSVWIDDRLIVDHGKLVFRGSQNRCAREGNRLWLRMPRCEWYLPKPDTLFSLMETAIRRQLTPGGEKSLRYFFGPDFSAPLARLTGHGRHAGLAPFDGGCDLYR